MSTPAQAAGDPAAVPGIAPQSEEVGLRSERVIKELAYVAIGLPLGALYAGLLLGGLVLGTLLAPIWIGLPLLLASSGVLWSCAALERRLANRLLGTRISPLPPLPAADHVSFGSTTSDGRYTAVVFDSATTLPSSAVLDWAACERHRRRSDRGGAGCRSRAARVRAPRGDRL